MEPTASIAAIQGHGEMPRFSASRRTTVDATAQEVHIESYFPADDATERRLRALASESPA